MEKDAHLSNSLIEQVAPLLNESISPSRTQSIVRRFIQAKVSDHSQDIASLNQMGFDGGMIKKVYLFLKPRNINEAIEMMSEVDGIYQHDFYECRAHSHLCFICKRERENHRDYTQGAMGYRKMKNNINRIIDSIMRGNEDSKSAIDSIEDHMITVEECRICYEKIDTSKGVILQCGHFCCRNCMFYYIKTEIENSKVFKLKCFERNCDSELNEDFVQSQIKDDKELLKKYDDYKVRATIYLSNDKKFCPEPDCNSYLQEDPTNRYVQCKNGHKYCYRCLKPWHGKSKCDEEIDKEFQIWKKDKVVKKCPRCKIYTEKNEGCNHMTCAECKFQWCWICEGEYQEGHFTKGTCNGLQFKRINYLSEKDKLKSILYSSYNSYDNLDNTEQRNSYVSLFVRDGYVREIHREYNQRAHGCCICTSNIRDKFWFFSQEIYITYYGNKCLMFFISFLLLLFFFVPWVAISFLYEYYEKPLHLRKVVMRIIMVLYLICLFICYQLLMTSLMIPLLLLLLPIPKIFKGIVREINYDNEYSMYEYY